MTWTSALLALSAGISIGVTPPATPAPTPPTPAPVVQQAPLHPGLVPFPFPQPTGPFTSSAPPETAKTTPPLAPGSPEWCKPLPGHRVECGTMTRPLVVGKPQLGTIDVAYTLVRRSDEASPPKNTIVVNPGGPGGAAIAGAQFFVNLIGSLGTDHDLLLIDPRGVGYSSPVTCGLDIKDIYLAADRPRQRRLIGQCGTALGPRAEGYTSAATADDFDAVRRLLGIDKVVLYGLSYGTYLMPIYAERHPDTVKSIVLSGAYPVAFDSLGGPSARAISLSLKRVCERSGACDGRAAIRDLRRVTATLRANPIDVPYTVNGEPRTAKLTEHVLATSLTYDASGGVGAFPDEVLLIGRMPALLHKAARGDTGPLVEWYSATFQAIAQESGDVGLSTTVICNDYARAWSVDAPLRKRYRQYDRAVDRADPGEFGAFSPEAFGASLPDGGDACIEWPKDGTARPYVLQGKLPHVPTLVLSGDLDNNTPDENGRLNAGQFLRARFLSVPNTGHVPELDSTGCAQSIVVGFVRAERLGDTSCLASIPAVKVNPVP
ncbi:alpha/beta fold hydrolase [Nonomuraea sp. NPDC046570]|uniref:alpha/beta fold hydrolase n=1 Tax=Nonomuraea sp. NPDC046570 TaxID=3155255 RepID=UPI0033F1E55D